jgi:Protein of unknown function (DUF3105)
VRCTECSRSAGLLPEVKRPPVRSYQRGVSDLEQFRRSLVRPGGRGIESAGCSRPTGEAIQTRPKSRSHGQWTRDQRGCSGAFLTFRAPELGENAGMGSRPQHVRYWLAGGALFAAAIWGAAVLLSYRQDAERTAKLEATRGTVVISKARAEGDLKPALNLEVRYTGFERTHTLGEVRYNLMPPVGGPHSPTWQNCGAYTAPIPTMTAVHSLEHGAVWITYKPDLDAVALERLRSLAKKPYVLVSPYPTQSVRITATAWGVQLQLGNLDAPRLENFISRYANRKDGPEPGSPCVGGTGIPMSAI